MPNFYPRLLLDDRQTKIFSPGYCKKSKYFCKSNRKFLQHNNRFYLFPHVIFLYISTAIPTKNKLHPANYQNTDNNIKIQNSKKIPFTNPPFKHTHLFYPVKYRLCLYQIIIIQPKKRKLPYVSIPMRLSLSLSLSLCYISICMYACSLY